MYQKIRYTFCVGVLAMALGCTKSSDSQSGSGAPNLGHGKSSSEKSSPLVAEVKFTSSSVMQYQNVLHYSDGSALAISDDTVLEIKSKVACSVMVMDNYPSRDHYYYLVVSVDSKIGNDPYEGYDLMFEVDLVSGTDQNGQHIRQLNAATNYAGYPIVGIRGCFQTPKGRTCKAERKAFFANEGAVFGNLKLGDLDSLVISGEGSIDESNQFVKFNVNCGKIDPALFDYKHPAPPPPVVAPTPPAPPMTKMAIPPQLNCNAVETTDDGQYEQTQVTINIITGNIVTGTLVTDPKVDITLEDKNVSRTYRFGEVVFHTQTLTPSNSKCQSLVDSKATNFTIQTDCDMLVNGGQTVASHYRGVLEMDDQGNGQFEMYGQPTNLDEKLLKAYRLTDCKP